MKKSILVCLLFLPLMLAAQVRRTPMRESTDDSLGKLARAATLKELSELRAKAPNDVAHRAVHAAMYFKLKGEGSDFVLLQALPKNGQEMEDLSEAQYAKEGDLLFDGRDNAAIDAYFGYYEAVTEAVARHPQYLPHFLRLINGSYDEYVNMCAWASEIYEKIPKEYMKAVGKLGRQYRDDALYCRVAPPAAG